MSVEREDVGSTLTGRDRPLVQIQWRQAALLWLIAAAAWTPAAHLAGEPESYTFLAVAGMFLQMLLHFAPWAISAPLFLGLSRRFPIGLGRTTPHTLLFALLGFVVIPLFTAVGVVAARLLSAFLFGAPSEWTFDNLANAVVITSLFALPTYVALVAIGQTVTYFDRYRQRARRRSAPRSLLISCSTR